MTTQIVVTHHAADSDGMTLGELHTALGQMLDRGVPAEQVVRVRTRITAHKHGAPIRTITATSDGAK